MTESQGGGGPLTFLGLPEGQDAFEHSRAVILSVPFDGTASYGDGARFGPAALLRASAYVETWDEELELPLEGFGFCTLPALEVASGGQEETMARIYNTTKRVLERAGDRFFLALGGEHSISAPIVRAFAEKYPGLSVLHLDAHADLRDSYEGSRDSHACACRRIREHVETTVSVGVRSLSAPEAALIKEDGIPVYPAREIAGRTEWIDEVIDFLGDVVYVTIDLDVLDPSVMPATGTPEPGGIGWWDLLGILRRVAAAKQVVGADLVELAPIPGLHAPDFLAARLAAKVVAYCRESEIRALSA